MPDRRVIEVPGMGEIILDTVLVSFVLTPFPGCWSLFGAPPCLCDYAQENDKVFRIL